MWLRLKLIVRRKTRIKIPEYRSQFVLVGEACVNPGQAESYPNTHKKPGKGCAYCSIRSGESYYSQSVPDDAWWTYYREEYATSGEVRWLTMMLGKVSMEVPAEDY